MMHMEALRLVPAPVLTLLSRASAPPAAASGECKDEPEEAAASSSLRCLLKQFLPLLITKSNKELEQELECVYYYLHLQLREKLKQFLPLLVTSTYRIQIYCGVETTI